MKVLSLIAESFNRFDLSAEDWPDSLDRFSLQTSFDLSPANCSVSALWSMQSGAMRGIEVPRLGRSRIFRDEGEYLADVVRTRLISSAWPTYCNARRLDPLANVRGARRGEQAAETLRNYLASEFYTPDGADHLIHWGRIGHVGVREKSENRGIPETLRKTWAQNVDWLASNVFPLVRWDETLVLIHPDHGTRRRGRSVDESMHAGFLLSSLSIPFVVRHWFDLGELIVRAVATPIPKREGGK